MRMTRLLRWILIAGSAALCTSSAGAQTYPGKPVVIDNRPGASGNIAMEAVARAAPDGYTLGFANTGNITINPFLFTHLPFDPLNDLVPVGPIGTVPLFLVINGQVPA